MAQPASGNGVQGVSGSSKPSAIILAAGMGKRMQSDLPKVLHPVGDPARPMVQAVIDACRGAGCGRIVLIVGYKQELVRDAVAKWGHQPDVEFAVQAEQLGTGHAVRCAEHLFKSEIAAGVGKGGNVFVLAGDGPLIRAETLRTLLEKHESAGALATLATSVIDDPTGYGRIVRESSGGMLDATSKGKFVGIVEHKECSADQLKIREVNPSYYCFDTAALFGALERVKRNESSGEYYITDVPGMLLGDGACVEVIAAVPPEDVLSVNSPEQLAEVDRIYRSRSATGGMAASKGGAAR